MKVGDRVKIIPGTQFYYQAPDVAGTVIGCSDDSYWVAVTWDFHPDARRHSDNYPIDDLIHLNSTHRFPEDDFSEDQIAMAEEIIRGK